MKYNLKNRPHPWAFKKMPTTTGLKIEEWFKGFEKELREIKDAMNACNDRDRKYFKQTINVVKEILGE